jgi:hypothetical protein
MDYRDLTEEEIVRLEDNGCYAEDWTNVYVGEDFQPTYIKNVKFFGEVYLGVFERNIEVEEDFFRHSGIYDAVLRNVTIGDNCLIENVGNYISGYTIGEESYISNIGTLSVTSGATFGEYNEISVLKEEAKPNVLIFSGLTSQLAALMVNYSHDRALMAGVRRLAEESAGDSVRAEIGYRVKIVNTREILNSHIGDDCEISGASRLNETSLYSTPESSIWIGADVICENSIVQAGSSVLDGAKLDNCFVGEACHIGKGFSAENSLFFANSYMDNGEACAAFCGPFSVSHHKSTLLIGGMYSFYNAGSNTNFSNHAYKLGPIHYGIMDRGSRTASGAHILWPAHIGAFSMVMGKIQNHPDTTSLPFSYVIASGDTTYIVPGRNIATVGTYRDVRKWPKRDRRPRGGRQSLVHLDWLSPFVMEQIIKGKRLLESLRREQGDNVAAYNYEGCLIKNHSLMKGIEQYDLAIRCFVGEQVKRHGDTIPGSTIGTGQWTDLSGLLLPETEVQQLAGGIISREYASMDELNDAFITIYRKYDDYKWAWTYRLIMDYYGVDTLDEEEISKILSEYTKACQDILAAVRFDAEKEFRQGDVDEETLKNFLNALDNQQ